MEKKQKKPTDEQVFNFDIARMNAALKAPKHLAPKGLSREEFREWMQGKQSG